VYFDKEVHTKFWKSCTHLNFDLDFGYRLWIRTRSTLAQDSAVRVLLLKIKVKAEHLYSALHGIQTTLKRSGMDHTVLPAINTTPAFTS